MPELVQLCKDYSDKGVIFIGIHRQNEPREKVVALCEEMGINFTITDNGGIKGKEVSGIPKCAIFDHTGTLVYMDHPSNGFDQKLKECVEAAPDILTGPGPFIKLKAMAGDIKNRKNLGKHLKALREKINSADADEQKEAALIYPRLLKHAQKKLDSAKALQATAPALCLERLGEAAKAFKDDETGAQAQELLNELKKDPSFKKELDAEKDLAKLEKSIKDELKPCPECETFSGTCAACREKNEKALKGLKADIEKFVKKHAGTSASRKCEALLPK